MEKGLIEMTIPDKPNSSKQKYRKTKEKYRRKKLLIFFELIASASYWFMNKY